MKKTINILVFIAASVLIFTGCVTKNPQYTPVGVGQPDTNTVPPYVTDPRLIAASNSVTTIASAVAPVNPYAALTDPLIKYGFGLIGLVTSVVLGKKNNQKAAVIETMAAGVVKAGPSAAQAVINHASTTDEHAAVSAAINDNTGANQTPIGGTI